MEDDQVARAAAFARGAAHRHHLETSLEAFAGSSAYGPRQLSDDLARFIFLVGGSDGEPLFGQQQ